jgi:uncharacterized RDD family membrane protein YckC
MPHDRLDIGWWVKSTDEELYGPMSRATVWNYVETGVLTPDTLVRHSLSLEFQPLAEQPGLQGAPAFGGSGTRDQLEQAWPRKGSERLALAAGPYRCLRHNRPATQVCMCCLGAYCEKCRVNSRKVYHYCRKCHAGLYNARGIAFVVDSILLRIFVIIAAALAAVLDKAVGIGAVIVLFAVLVPVLWFVFRDAMAGGAGPGKLMTGVRVVRSEEPERPLGFGQGFVRSLPGFIPFFNLIDLSVPYRDTLWRRFGDRWARTRVLFKESKVLRLRTKAARQMEKKVGEFLPVEAPPRQEQIARLE